MRTGRSAVDPKIGPRYHRSMADNDSSSAPQRFFGKYRGAVVNNADPEQRGRLQVQVPDVSALDSSAWALPCAPFAASGAGFLALPSVGASIWVEFEAGDPSRPIWTGAFWAASGDAPAGSAAGPAAGGLVLKASGGAMIVLNDDGITLDDGKGARIVLAGDTVSIGSSGPTVTFPSSSSSSSDTSGDPQP